MASETPIRNRGWQLALLVTGVGEGGLDVFGDEVDHHGIGHHGGAEFVGDAGEFFQGLLEDERDVLAQVGAGHEEEGVAEDVVGAASDEFFDGDGDEGFAEFHEARFDEVVAEALADLVDEFDHDLVAFLEA